MSPFEFLFSFISLILGLAVAQVAAGIGHAVAHRKEYRIGLLTPMLAFFVLCDLSSFWVVAWLARSSVPFHYGMVNVSMLLTLVYFVAATLIFPPSNGPWEDLDRHYWENKRLVIAGVLLVNIVTTAHALATRGGTMGGVAYWLFQLVYFPPLVALLVSRQRGIDIVALAVLIAGAELAVIGDFVGKGVF